MDRGAIGTDMVNLTAGNLDFSACSKKAIIDEILDMGLHFKRESIAAHLPTVNGIQSEKDTTPGAHPLARVYWLPKEH